jgi:hypothetical protein
MVAESITFEKVRDCQIAWSVAKIDLSEKMCVKIRNTPRRLYESAMSRRREVIANGWETLPSVSSGDR